MAKSNFETSDPGIHIASTNAIEVVGWHHICNKTDRIYRVKFRGVIIGDILSDEPEYDVIKGMIFERSKYINDLKLYNQLAASICDAAFIHVVRHTTAEDLREIWRRGFSEGQEDGREEVRAYFRKGLGL